MKNILVFFFATLCVPCFSMNYQNFINKIHEKVGVEAPKDEESAVVFSFKNPAIAFTLNKAVFKQIPEFEDLDFSNEEHARYTHPLSMLFFIFYRLEIDISFDDLDGDEALPVDERLLILYDLCFFAEMIGNQKEEERRSGVEPIDAQLARDVAPLIVEYIENGQITLDRIRQDNAEKLIPRKLYSATLAFRIKCAHEERKKGEEREEETRRQAELARQSKAHAELDQRAQVLCESIIKNRAKYEDRLLELASRSSNNRLVLKKHGHQESAADWERACELFNDDENNGYLRLVAEEYEEENELVYCCTSGPRGVLCGAVFWFCLCCCPQKQTMHRLVLVTAEEK